MTYHLARDGTQLGTFEQAELNAAVASGRLRLTDLAWCEGMGDWQPLSTIVKPLEPKPVEASSAMPPPMPAQPMAPPLAMSPTGTSGMAITSLVLGIASVACGCLTGLPAILFGVLAINKIGKSGGSLGGKGIAIAGMVCGGVMMVFGTAILAGLAVPAFNSVQERARQLQASNNARSIIIAMKTYAGDHSGAYPDADESKPQTSNDAFRVLIKNGIIDDERIFGLGSNANGENSIGNAPDFAEALTAGENHWAIMMGLSDSSTHRLPLIFQAPVQAGWPPVWNADAVDDGDHPLIGGAFRGGKVIIGRNDGSVNAERLESVHGAEVPLGVPLFDPAQPQDYLMPVP